MDAALDLTVYRHLEELCQTWQARALIGAKDRMRMCVISVLAHNFDEEYAIPTLLVATGDWPLKAPFLCTAARILKNGNVVANVVTADGQILKYVKLFENERAMESSFRILADKIKLDDRDRRALFAAVRRWVVCDYRLDPNMDPMDPDAKRLVVH